MAQHSTMTKVRGRIIYSLYYGTPFCLYALQRFFNFHFRFISKANSFRLPVVVCFGRVR